MTVPVKLPVRIYYDEEAANWHFHVPELHIVGGGQTTRAQARRAAAEAVAFVLRGEPTAESPELEYLDIAVG